MTGRVRPDLFQGGLGVEGVVQGAAHELETPGSRMDMSILETRTKKPPIQIDHLGRGSYLFSCLPPDSADAGPGDGDAIKEGASGV
jgi:hypothetical protein